MRPIFSFCILFFCAISAYAQTRDDFRERIASAIKAADLRAGGPFVILANIVATQGQNRGEGKYRLIWISKDRWREDVALGPDFLVHIAREGKIQSKASSPKSEDVLVHFSDLAEFPEAATIPDTKIEVGKRKEGGENVDCWMYPQSSPVDHPVCLNQTGQLVRIGEAHYSDFRFGLDKQFPYTWWSEWNSIRFSANVESINPVHEVAAELFATDDTFHIAPMHCSNPRRGSALSAPKPPYPALARQARVQGTVVIKARINTNGDIESAEVVSGHPMLRDAALGAVRGWKYVPAQCGGVAVPVETEISVNFSIGG